MASSGNAAVLKAVAPTVALPTCCLYGRLVAAARSAVYPVSLEPYINILAGAKTISIVTIPSI